jgi:phosphomannomutase
MITRPVLPADAWKPCDLRGVYPDAVSPHLFREIGSAIGTVLAAGARVLVAGDFRLSTPRLKDALCNGLLRTGLHVLDAGQGPTPLAYFAATQVNADAVLIITASHNPVAYNGLKLMLGSVPTTPQQLAHIRSVTETGSFRSGQGSLETVDLWPAYTKAMLQRWSHLNGSRQPVVLDAGNGAWSEMAPEIFHSLGFATVCLSCVADGNFPDRSPDCAGASHLAGLRAAVRENPGAIGVAWDGDGDRVAFVDEEGSYVSPDEIAILFAYSVLDRQAPLTRPDCKMVVDVKCSEAVRRAILQRCGTPLLERTGHAFMRSRMVAESASLGLDACGHYFFLELGGGDDGLYSALYLLHLVQESGRTLADLRHSLPPIFSSPEIRIPGDVLPFRTASAALTAAFPGASIMQMDGARFVMEDGVVLVRESGTEPVLSLRIEGFTSASHDRILAQCLRSLPQARQNILAVSSTALDIEN